MKQLKYFLELEARVTPGEWFCDHDESEYALKQLNMDDSGEFRNDKVSVLKSWDFEGYSSGIYIRKVDSDFIATSRNLAPKAVRALLLAIDALEKISHNTKRSEARSNEALEQIKAIIEGE